MEGHDGSLTGTKEHAHLTLIDAVCLSLSLFPQSSSSVHGRCYILTFMHKNPTTDCSLSPFSFPSTAHSGVCITLHCSAPSSIAYVPFIFPPTCISAFSTSLHQYSLTHSPTTMTTLTHSIRIQLQSSSLHRRCDRLTKQRQTSSHPRASLIQKST